MSLPKKVRIVEVSPRDGLQNEPVNIPSAIKIDFINRLSHTGLQSIEVTSFVSPKWIPQLADSKVVFEGITQDPNLHYSALIPNIRGLENALESKIKNIAIFTAASTTFCQKNINCTLEESLKRYAVVMEKAKQHNLWVRGYISCALACPYEGKISPTVVANLAEKLIHMGCDEISLGDTIGVATPLQVQTLISTVLEKVSLDKIAVHFHDTYGQALANIYAALEIGVSIIDSSVAGLGGCPYAKGASGNVATEDVVYLLEGLNIETGISLPALIDVGNFISQYTQHPNRSKVAIARS